MSKWRPKGWNESADATAKQCAMDERFRDADLANVIWGMFEAGADAMLEKVCEEIEKVENPWQSEYMTAELYNSSADRAFDGCHKLILALLRSV